MKGVKIIGTFILMMALLAGCSDLTPTFEEVRVVKAKDNRIYAIYTTTDNKKQMETYAKKKKWANGSTTSVYFFSDRLEVPAKSYLEASDELPEQCREHMAATYIRHPDGSDEFLE